MLLEPPEVLEPTNPPELVAPLEPVEEEPDGKPPLPSSAPPSSDVPGVEGPFDRRTRKRAQNQEE